ncbi:MAG: hypothetical protein Q8J68_08025 [Methanolobus sp.]|uniref:hypothetical protein n=1 Tax=Methanolobus sp. TaxID=1874737 RepID=UPI0027302C1E|nr:hypothetical protein [Methanolobus sp.]MDP2217216.1 hypothetical protein [Methanolobus sp.]
MVINPGEITLELLLGENPLYYMLFVYVGALVLAGIASWWADRQADNSLKADAREIDPLADTTQVYEFENVRDPILAGVLVCVAVVFPMCQSIDIVSGWQGVYASAVLAGITARMILKSLAAKFAAKVTK